MTTTILTIAAACAGVALGAVATAFVFLPTLNHQRKKVELLFDMLEEAAMQNDFLMAERNGRVRVKL